MPDPSFDNEYSTPKITPSVDVKIPSVGSVSGYQTDGELRDFINAGVTGVTEQYSSLLTYEYGKRLMNEGVEYRCIVPVESPEVFDPDKWEKVDLTELDKRVLANADAINAINTAINGVTVRKGKIDSSHPLQLEIGSNATSGSMGFLIMSRDNLYSFGAFCLMAGYNDGRQPIVIELGKGQWISYDYPSEGDESRFRVIFSSSSAYAISYALVTFNGIIRIL